jgi:hypothetical protein
MFSQTWKRVLFWQQSASLSQETRRLWVQMLAPWGRRTQQKLSVPQIADEQQWLQVPRLTPEVQQNIGCGQSESMQQLAQMPPQHFWPAGHWLSLQHLPQTPSQQSGLDDGQWASTQHSLQILPPGSSQQTSRMPSWQSLSTQQLVSLMQS